MFGGAVVFFLRRLPLTLFSFKDFSPPLVLFFFYFPPGIFFFHPHTSLFFPPNPPHPSFNLLVPSATPSPTKGHFFSVVPFFFAQPVALSLSFSFGLMPTFPSSCRGWVFGFPRFFCRNSLALFCPGGRAVFCFHWSPLNNRY